MNLIKSHAFGNDFLLVEECEVAGVADIPAFARTVCERHRGIGADGLLIFGGSAGGTTMRLLNADGSASEISGNGLRCLAAWLAHRDGGRDIEVMSGAGLKRLQLLDRTGSRYTFRAAMGQPEELTQEAIAVGRTTVTAVTLRVGNPQCVVLGDVTVERLHSVAAALAVHPRFPAGTNVELATVEAPDRVRILIWERGVGPTEASGTGACAAAVAAMAYGGAARAVDVISPGGSQRVEWRADGLYLTGWAELVGEVRWLAGEAESQPKRQKV
jgi:diaminopimelate epimerase